MAANKQKWRWKTRALNPFERNALHRHPLQNEVRPQETPFFAPPERRSSVKLRIISRRGGFASAACEKGIESGCLLSQLYAKRK